MEGGSDCEPLATTTPAHRQANKQIGERKKMNSESSKNVVNQTEAQGLGWLLIPTYDSFSGTFFPSPAACTPPFTPLWVFPLASVEYYFAFP